MKSIHFLLLPKCFHRLVGTSSANNVDRSCIQSLTPIKDNLVHKCRGILVLKANALNTAVALGTEISEGVSAENS